MALEHVYAAVTSRATNGLCTLKTSKGVAEVARGTPGIYSVNLPEPLVNLQCAVDVCINAGDATHRFTAYDRVSLQRIDVRLFNDVATPAGLDVDFTIEVWADNDASIGA